MQQDNISKNNFEQCLKCDLCTTVCPMKSVNPDYPGPKQAGPDGERYRIRDPRFYDLTLRFCLNCKRCEVACPSGVEVGDIIQTARIKYGRSAHALRNSLIANTDFVGSVATSHPRAVNGLADKPSFRSILDAFGIDKRRHLPQYASERFSKQFNALSQDGYARFVTFYHGCYVEYNYPSLGAALIELLNVCGYGVRLLDREKCCGAAFINNGLSARARINAKANAASIRKALENGSEDIVTTSATCTLTIRNDYDHLLGVKTDDIRQHVMLATKWLFGKIDSGEIRLAFREDWKGHYAYHTSCHMQMLGWQIYSIDLLKMIPGMQLDVLDQECCGIAGTFGYKKENYEYSQKIGEKLFADIARTGAGTVVADCETCKWQIENGTGIKVLNTIEVLLDALDIQKTRELNR